MTFDELYKKVINASKAFEERQVPIRLDFKIEDLRDALVESNVTIEKLVGAKKSAEQILQNLLDCGLIKEWYFNGKFYAVLNADDPHLQIAELKKKLEDAKATAYAESVDAGMRERKLKRALWLARAERANEIHYMWCQLIYDKKYGIVKFNVRKNWWGETVKQGQTLHTPQGWADVWDIVEYKCRENACAITKLEEALLWLRKRTMGRENRGVEGTNKV